MTECPKCGRTSRVPQYADDEMVYCFAAGGEICRIAAAALRRGVLRGVEIAKRHAELFHNDEIDWTEVDRVVAEEVGR
jgi:hypothetical protein